MKLYFPENYKSYLDLRETERAIKLVKDIFSAGPVVRIKIKPGYCSAFCYERNRDK